MTSTKTKLPDVTPCEFCGKDRKRRYIKSPIKAMAKDENGKGSHKEQPMIPFGYEPCNCPEAVAHREKVEREEEERRKAQEEKERKSRYKRAGIPPYYLLHSKPEPEYAERVKEGQGFYFEGPNGTGKSMTAMGVAMSLCDDRITVKVTSMREVMHRIQSAAAYGSDRETVTEVFRSLTAPYLLIIEDLGKENITSRELTELFDLIDTRKNDMKPVVITTNYTKRELIDRLALNGDTFTAEAIVSRLFEITEKVPFDGEDWRLK